MNDAAAEQPSPDAVDYGAGEPGIGRRDQPVGKRGSRVAVRWKLCRSAVGKDRGLPQVIGGLAGVPKNDFLFPFRCRFVADLCEKHRQIGQLGARPPLGSGAHERERHRLGNALGIPILHRPVEVDRWRAKVAAVGGQQQPDKLVVRHVFLETGANPVVVGLHGVWPEVDRKLGFDAEQIAPLHGPVIHEFVALQQPVDQQGALVQIAVVQKLARFLGGGDRADHIQKCPAEKHGIGAKIGRRDL